MNMPRIKIVLCSVTSQGTFKPTGETREPDGYVQGMVDYIRQERPHETSTLSDAEVATRTLEGMIKRGTAERLGDGVYGIYVTKTAIDLEDR
jgi:hypothetical protein